MFPGGISAGKATALSGAINIAVPNKVAKGGVTLGVRSEDVIVGPKQMATAKIHDVENHGVEKILTLRIENVLIRATVPASMSITIDATAKFGFKAGKVHCFDPVSGNRLFSNGAVI